MFGVGGGGVVGTGVAVGGTGVVVGVGRKVAARMGVGDNNRVETVDVAGCWAIGGPAAQAGKVSKAKIRGTNDLMIMGNVSPIRYPFGRFLLFGKWR